MLAQVSSRQFEEWRAYAELEPFDEKRADHRSAQIVQALADLEVARRGRRPRSQLKDFVLRFGDDAAAPKTPEQARADVVAAMTIIRAIYAPTDGKGN